MLRCAEGNLHVPHIQGVESDHYWKAKHELAPMCCISRCGMFLQPVFVACFNAKSDFVQVVRGKGSVYCEAIEGIQSLLLYYFLQR